MLSRALILLAVSALVADALHASSLAPAPKSPGAMAAARLKRTPTLHALRGGSDDTMAVNFVWFSCFAVAASAMVRDRVLVTCFGVDRVASSEFRPPPPHPSPGISLARIVSSIPGTNNLSVIMISHGVPVQHSLRGDA